MVKKLKLEQWTIKPKKNRKISTYKHLSCKKSCG